MERRPLARALKRGAALLLGATLALTTLAAAPARAAVTFTDVPQGTQFRTEILWLAERGISTGWDVGGGRREYRPTQPINRDAMAAFLYRYAGEPAFPAPAVSPFDDIKPGDQFYKEVAWLAARGISEGWTVGSKKEFRPLAPIGRDAMAAFLYRFEGKPAYTAPTRSPFSDLNAQVQFYREMTWLAAKGITTGWDQVQALPQYRPVQPINRDAMAAFLYRLEVTKTGPRTPPAPDAASDKPIVGTMPAGFDRSLQGGDYPEELMSNLLILQPCSTALPYTTLDQRVASWGKDYWGEEAGSSEFSLVFSSVGAAMAFMADARAHGHCAPVPNGYNPEYYTHSEYSRPYGPWDEALMVLQEERRFDGTQAYEDLPFGSYRLVARRGPNVVIVWLASWYESPYTDLEAFDSPMYVDQLLSSLE